MPGPVFLAGDAVELRTVEVEDADFLQSVVNDPRVRRGLAQFAPVSGHQEREWVESLGDDAVRLLVCVDGDPVGTVSMQPPDVVWGVAELGYLLDPEAWGNGYATDAVGCICRYAFAERRLNKLFAKAYATNSPPGASWRRTASNGRGCSAARRSSMGSTSTSTGTACWPTSGVRRDRAGASLRNRNYRDPRPNGNPPDGSTFADRSR